MLPLPLIQLWAAIALVATFATFVIGASRRASSTGPVHVVAKNPPAPGTQSLWLLATFTAVLWPFGVFIAPGYAYGWPGTFNVPGSWVIQVVGVVIGASGGVLFSVAARALGQQMTPVIRVRQDHQLLQTGPYRFIRHPVYTAIVGIALGQTFIYLSPPLALVTVLLAGLASYRARLEESLLSSPRAFGATYDAYIARTGRFLPRLRPRTPRRTT